jgi:cephalosporin hydroxylase
VTGAPIGPFVVDCDQPPLSAEDIAVVERFHELYFQRWLRLRANTTTLSWFGHELLKCPMDLWMYQELLVRMRPDLVVETGTRAGGSAYYLAMLLDHLGHGEVVSIDTEIVDGRPEHARITYITASSTDPEVVAGVRERAAGGRTLVILDSDHSRAHVLDELHAYAGLTLLGDHLIVEDTNVNGHPTMPEHGPGPMEAVDEFLAETDEFEVDARCERFLMTLNPRGYLKRVRAVPAAS